MKNLWILFLLIPVWTIGQPNAAADCDWILADVRIIDVKTGEISSPMDIGFNKDRITYIEPTAPFPKSWKNRIIQGKGQFLIPGLWDMHAHPDDPEVWRMNPDPKGRDLLMPQFVLHGVTGIRDMAGSLAVINDWREKGKNGELLVPEIFAAGPLLDGPNPMWDGSIGIDGVEQVQPVVDSLIEAGVDFLKVYSLLPRDIYFSLAAYAQKRDFPFVGHVPLTVRPSEAAVTGMRSQEHLLEILLECSDSMQAILDKKIDYSAVGDRRFDQYIYRNRLMIKTFNEQKADRLYQLYVKHNIWHCPTLSMWYKNAWFEQELEEDNVLFEYLPQYLRTYWTPAHNDHLKYRDIKPFIVLKQDTYVKYLEMVNSMHKAGVKLLAGTDMGANPLCFPGIGVHNELEQLVAAGLSPSEALKTATLHPAEFLEIDDDFGTVEVGKIADLVLLKSNPLNDIEAIRTIQSVIKRGNFFDKKEIDQILEKIRDALKN